MSQTDGGLKEFTLACPAATDRTTHVKLFILRERIGIQRSHDTLRGVGIFFKESDHYGLHGQRPWDHGNIYTIEQ